MSSSDSTLPPVNVGMSNADRMQIVDGLSRLLADTYTLYLKTHNFHWNVTGPMFQTLHQLFMQFYTEQWTAVDLIAERIRSLGERSPGSYEEFAKLTSIKPIQGQPNAREMMIELVEGQETIARVARAMFGYTELACDQPTCELLAQRMQIHEKNAWMLRSLLAE
jgi:starvation-inducible DNA-binding protein